MTRPRNHAAPSPVVTLVRPITGRLAVPTGAAGTWIRPFQDEHDLDDWLRLQNEVFADQRVGRPWGRADFQRELAGRPGWNPEHLLLSTTGRPRRTIGSVALQSSIDGTWAQVHWLAVHAEHRRQGVATQLVDEASRLAFRLGNRELRAETLRSWASAIHFYRSIGFKDLV